MIPLGPLLPGETPIDDISGLRNKSIKTRGELSAAEARNINDGVLLKYFADDTLSPEIAPFDIVWARQLHFEMFGDVWVWAGEFRTRDLNIGCPWPEVQQRLYNLLADLAYWKNHGVDLIEQATRLHHRSVQIHPFLNGNGRWGRMRSNIWLTLHHSGIVEWPENLIGDRGARHPPSGLVS